MTDDLGTTDPPVTREELMRYLDGEVSPEDRERIEGRLAHSTELQRELMIFRTMKEDLLGLTFRARPNGRSAWGAVNRRLTRPAGWLLLVAGVVTWLVYGVYVYSTAPINPVEKLATGAVAIGILLLLTSVIWERYRVWLTDPYRDVQQ